MVRRSEIWLVVAVTAVLAVAAAIGTATAPRGMSSDPRLSTRLTSPNGAAAFRTLLTRFGVDVGERLKPFFDLDRTRADPGLLLFIPAPAAPLTDPEVREVRHWVERGGRLLLAGRSGMERCFGYVIRTIEFAPPAPWQPGEGLFGGRAPKARAVLRRPDADAKDAPPLAAPAGCPALKPVTTEDLWTAAKGETAAVRLRFAAGGTVVLVADGSVFSNRAMRATEAGPLVLGWVLEDRPRLVLVDEYHQGFGRAGSLMGATFAWSLSEPAGWMALQLIFAALLGLGVAAVRFGPAIPAVERRRRSPLEHLDALAAGLERSGAGLTATRLIAAGLRRRLGGGPLKAADTLAWLDALEAGAQRPPAREAVKRLKSRVHQGARGADVQGAANAVEDLWQMLKVPTRTPS
ncbi:MAG: DUF4350 domain-containing protein [Gemmatimonadales bacterium]